MRTHPDVLSAQAVKRLQGGELILKGYDNDEIADIVPYEARWCRKVAEQRKIVVYQNLVLTANGKRR